MILFDCADSSRGIGVPKRNAPPRNTRVRDGPKRAYRKRKYAWPSLRSDSPQPPTEEKPLLQPSLSLPFQRPENLDAGPGPGPGRELSTAPTSFGVGRDASLSPSSVSWSESSIGSAQERAFVQSSSSAMARPLLYSYSSNGALNTIAAPSFLYTASCSASSTGPPVTARSDTPSPSESLLSARNVLNPSDAMDVAIEQPGFISQRFSCESNPKDIQTASHTLSSAALLTGGSANQCDIQTVQSPIPLLSRTLSSGSGRAAAAWNPPQMQIQTPPPIHVVIPKNERVTPPLPNYTRGCFAEGDFNFSSQQMMGAHSECNHNPNGPNPNFNVAMTPQSPPTISFMSPLPAHFLNNYTPASALSPEATPRPLPQWRSMNSQTQCSNSAAHFAPWPLFEPLSGNPISPKSTSDSGSLSLQCDPRARQSADKALVTHTLKVEPSPDPRFDLFITTESRCSSVV